MIMQTLSFPLAKKNLIQGHKTKMMTTICEIPSAEPSSKKKKKSMKIIDK